MKKVITSERLPIKLWLDNIESGALEQAKNIANLRFAWKWIAIMPDCHQGYGMPIGGVMATKDGVIVPNAVGVDIGCGMVASKTNITEIDTDTIKQVLGEIRKTVPVGFNHNKEKQDWDGFDKAPDLPVIQRELESAKKQLGTLGGGNHFIELQKGSDGHIWIMLHSGSRNFGLKVAVEYHDKAKELCERWISDIPSPDLSFLPMDTKLGEDYFQAMNYCLDFALASRSLMMDRSMASLNMFTGAVEEDRINIHHNYAAMEHHYNKNVLVHRKGATRARKGQVGIIPGSMGTNSYIVLGLGNKESFMSCSHGAGRVMGRNQAKKELVLEDEQKRMAGVVHGLRNKNDLDEAPSAYKDIDTVMENQSDLVEVAVTLSPLGNIKG